MSDKASKREARRQKHREAVLELSSIFTHLDLELLHNFYKKANESVEGAIELIIDHLETQPTHEEPISTKIIQPVTHVQKLEEKVQVIASLLSPAVPTQYIIDCLKQYGGDVEIALGVLQESIKTPTPTGIKEDFPDRNENDDIFEEQIEESYSSEEELIIDDDEGFELGESDFNDYLIDPHVQQEMQIERLAKLAEERDKLDWKIAAELDLFQRNMYTELGLEEQLVQLEVQMQLGSELNTLSPEEIREQIRSSSFYVIKDVSHAQRIMETILKKSLTESIQTLQQMFGKEGDIKIRTVVKTNLVERFVNFVTRLQAKRGIDECPVTMAFHGTSPYNIENILKIGLVVPGTHGVEHATDTGYWGKGIYLSPNASISVSYCRGGGELLVCAIVQGKIFQCTQLIHGAPLTEGYDSHEDPSGSEIILFDEAQVVPIFVISFPQLANTSGASFQKSKVGKVSETEIAKNEQKQRRVKGMSKKKQAKAKIKK
jgi:hypothetical protein